MANASNHTEEEGRCYLFRNRKLIGSAVIFDPKTATLQARSHSALTTEHHAVLFPQALHRAEQNA
jgi:hypothetical protein